MPRRGDVHNARIEGRRETLQQNALQTPEQQKMREMVRPNCSSKPSLVRLSGGLLPPGITSLASHITDELPRLEEILLGLAHAASRGQLPRLAQVKWIKMKKRIVSLS
jgi:hypothetical protein